MTLGQQALSHPGETSHAFLTHRRDLSLGRQTGAWSHLRDKIWVGQIHQWLTMDKGCGLAPVYSAQLQLYLPHPEPKKAMDIEEGLVPLVALPSFRLLNEAPTSATSGGHRAILGNPPHPLFLP